MQKVIEHDYVKLDSLGRRYTKKPGPKPKPKKLCLCGKYAIAKGLCGTCYQKEDRIKFPEKHKAKQDRLYKKRRAWLRNRKKQPCIDCKQKFPPYVMQFDHLNPSTKLHGLSRMISRHSSINAMKKEIEKCDLVCANCHAIRTYKRRHARNKNIGSRIRERY